MTTIFGHEADLRGLIDTKELLHITDVIHKAYIEINEEGTEGAAAVGKFKKLLFILLQFIKLRIINIQILHKFKGIRAGSIGRVARTSFYADHPFVYHVWDKENRIPILSGHIKNIISPTTKILKLN